MVRSGLFWPFLLLAAVASTFAQDTDAPIRVETNLVSVPVIVSDRQGRYVPGLTAADFELTTNGRTREIAFFETSDEPLRVAILIDTSKSTEPILGKIRAAAREFVRVLRPADSAMIVTFDFEVRKVIGLTSDKDSLRRAIGDVSIGEFPGTVMRDAVSDSISKFLAGGKGRKAIILLTDGKDAGSATRENELLRMVEESDVMIFPVFFKTEGPMRIRRPRRPVFDRDDLPRRRNDRVRRRVELANERARGYLERLALLTAGRFFDTEDADIKKAFLAIADELRNQYRLGFYPEPGDEFGTIRVRVARPDVAVRSRESYRLSTPRRPE